MRIFILLIVLHTGFLTKSQVIKKEISKNWLLNQDGTASWHGASIPGSVHSDLYKNKLIPNPTTGDSEVKLQWINRTNWTYKTQFDVEKKIFQQPHIELIFEGLDTYADIYFNNQLVLQANNMHRKWVVNIKPFIKEKGNILLLKFHAAQNVVDSLAKKDLPLIIPDNARLYARKAQYQFGWDFAPKLTTCGIWRSIYIEAWSNTKLLDLKMDSFKIIDGVAKVYYETTIASDEQKMVSYSNTIYDLGNDFSNISSTQKLKLLQHKDNKSLAFQKKVLVQKGMTIYKDSILIRDPLLWQPNKKKSQQLYSLQVNCNENSIQKTIGLRTIELITQPDSISEFAALRNKKGTGFYFKVNGEPVYITGANYVPLDMFPGTVSKKRYEETIKAAKEANMNMLRIWGGGIYEDDYFYQLCDEAGIMIWQDFMFAGSMIPTNKSFYDNVLLEAKDNVNRLQHHPCMALWCGNNEVDEAWHNWGWQKQFNLSTTDSTILWNAYEAVFKKMLKEVVQSNAPNTAYWSSSPSIGWGRKESLLKGDCHYWGVWWGLEPIEKYNEKIPRFMSEYGMQSMPTWKSIQQFSAKKDWDTSTTVMKLHQKHPTGYYNLGVYLSRMFDKKIATNFKEYCYQTELLQAKAYETAIKAHRNAMPYNMGTLLWQLNEPWPAASWSIIDYYGNKKKAYWAVKKQYK